MNKKVNIASSNLFHQISNHSQLYPCKKDYRTNKSLIKIHSSHQDSKKAKTSIFLAIKIMDLILQTITQACSEKTVPDLMGLNRLVAKIMHHII